MLGLAIEADAHARDRRAIGRDRALDADGADRGQHLGDRLAVERGGIHVPQVEIGRAHV